MKHREMIKGTGSDKHRDQDLRGKQENKRHRARKDQTEKRQTGHKEVTNIIKQEPTANSEVLGNTKLKTKS